VLSSTTRSVLVSWFFHRFSIVFGERLEGTPPEGGSTEKKEEARQEGSPAATATTNLNSAKAEAKLVKALDYLVAINDNSDNPGQKWVINESILASQAVSGRLSKNSLKPTAPLSIRQTTPTG